jgi:hypothetical protein
MQLRLTVVREAEDRVVICVDGRLAANNVAELTESCRERKMGLALELGNLLSVDDTGIATLRGLAADGIELLNPSPYVAMLLGGRAGQDQRPSGRPPRGGPGEAGKR